MTVQSNLQTECFHLFSNIYNKTFQKHCFDVKIETFSSKLLEIFQAKHLAASE